MLVGKLLKWQEASLVCIIFSNIYTNRNNYQVVANLRCLSHLNWLWPSRSGDSSGGDGSCGGAAYGVGRWGSRGWGVSGGAQTGQGGTQGIKWVQSLLQTPRNSWFQGQHAVTGSVGRLAVTLFSYVAQNNLFTLELCLKFLIICNS